MNNTNTSKQTNGTSSPQTGTGSGRQRQLDQSHGKPLLITIRTQSSAQGNRNTPGCPAISQSQQEAHSYWVWFSVVPKLLRWMPSVRA